MKDSELIERLEYLINKIKDKSLPQKIREDLIELFNPTPPDKDMVEALVLGWYIKQGMEKQSERHPQN